MTERESLIERLDAAEGRLASLAPAMVRPAALTSAEPGSGERWEAGQVWAHLAEFIPYWIEQARQVITGAGGGEPVPFGRTKSDAGRIAAIDRDRVLPVSVLWSDTQADIGALRQFIGGVENWEPRGLHPTLGVMTAQRIVDEFLVGHIEEHADQLDGLTRNS